MSSIRSAPTLRARHLATLSAAAVAGLALTLGTAAGPAHAQSLAPQTDDEAERMVKDRQAEDSSSLNEGNVPEGISVSQARAAVDKSDALTPSDIEYAAALEDLPASGVPEDFYESPATLPESNGGVVKQTPSTFYLDPVKLLKHDAKTTTYMYRTTDERGTARAATATLLTPKGAEGPAKDAVVIAPGTQGIADKCAPSRQLGMGTEYEGISVASALASDRPVVVVDYVGLGTEGPHRFLNRTEEARSVLDAARAVQEVEGSGIDGQTKLQLRGYSQGGHATAAALELASDWAPELNIAAASAGAVPTDLNEALSQLPSAYNGFFFFAVDSFAEQADVDLSDHLNQKGLDTIEAAANQCTVESLLSNAFIDTTTLTKDGTSFKQLADEEFARTVEAQRLGQVPIPDIPVLVNHSRFDDVVPFASGRGLASTWCHAGNTVAFADNLGPTHIGGLLAAIPRIETFTNRTFADKAPLDSCWRL